MHLPVAHLKAGLRSFNRRMPKEHNRVLTDHAADLLLAPTQTAMGHLARDGLAERAVMVGEVMTDVCFRVRDAVIASRVDLPPGVNPAEPYVIGSAGVVTDSGGLQKEAYLLGAPCTTLRTETEWIQTLQDGWNILDPDLIAVRDVAVRPRPSAAQSQPLGDGHASQRVVAALRSRQG